MNPLVKRLSLLGASSVIAISGAYMVAPWEGKENHAYKDIVGVATICFGETKGVKTRDYRTDEQCEESLVSELAAYNKAMKKHVKVELKPYEEIAYTSFVWNVGETNFKNSTLLKKLNSGDRVGACNELPKWNKAGGNVVKGLTNRRLHEQKVCLGKDEAINSALNSFSVRHEALETLISTGQGVVKGEPISTLLGPLNEPEVSVPAIVLEAPVEKCWKFLWFCLK